MTLEAATGDVRPRCTTCSEPHERDQQYCLECGARLPSAPRVSYGTPLWAWAAVVALAMVAIVSGVIIALLASADQGDVARAPTLPLTATQAEPADAADTIAAPLEQPVTVPLDSGDAGAVASEPSANDLLSGDAGSGDAADDPGAVLDGRLDPSPTGDSSDGTPEAPALPLAEQGDWPIDTEGFTVILASIPEDRGRAAADAEAARAAASGLDEVGVLLSSAYPSLRRGYWVAFAGVYGTLNAARTEVAPARAAGFPTAYTRRVAR